MGLTENEIKLLLKILDQSDEDIESIKNKLEMYM